MYIYIYIYTYINAPERRRGPGCHGAPCFYCLCLFLVCTVCLKFNVLFEIIAGESIASDPHVDSS